MRSKIYIAVVLYLIGFSNKKKTELDIGSILFSIFPLGVSIAFAYFIQQY